MMRRSFIRAALSQLASGVMCAAGVLATMNSASADEPQVQVPAAASPSVLLLPPPPEVGVPLLSRIPLINRIFKSSGEASDGQEFERIGIDFDFAVAPNVSGPHRKATIMVCPTEGQAFAFGATQAAATQPAQCQSAPVVFSYQLPGAVGVCPTPPGFNPSACAVAQSMCVGPNGHCNGGTVIGRPQVQRFVAHCSESECCQLAGCETSAQVQAAVYEARTEMLSEFLPLAIEKAKLEGKLELVTERERMHEELLKLAITNAQLQARLEFQKEQIAMMQQTLKLAHENESLKQRVAELEQRSYADPVPVQARAYSPTPSTPR